MGRLGELLVQAGALEGRDLERGLLEHRRTGGKLGEVLVRLSLVTELQVTEALAQQLHLPVTPLDPLPEPDPAILSRIPAALAHAASVLPLELTEEGRVLVVAIDGPLRGERLEQVRASARCWILPRLAPESALRRAIHAAYGPPPVTGAPARESAPLDAGPDAPAEEGGGRLVHLTQAPPRPDPSAGPQDPEVRALVRLLLERGLLSAADVQKAFPPPLAGGPPQVAARQHDKEPS